MTKTITTLCCAFLFASICELRAQSFQAVYEFTSTAICPNTSLGVTAQPAHVTFSNFSASNVNCSPTTDVYNHSGWNTTGAIDLTEYIEYSVTAEDCYRLDLDTLIFTFRNSSTTSFPNWHIRSSLDNYAIDIKSGGSSNTLDTDTIVLDPTTFGVLTAINFRFYITGIQAGANTWRVDDVRTLGSVNYYGNQAFYQDVDGDGFGTGLVVPMCSNPGGYSLFDGDCDDTDPLINPATVWYADMDNDGYGDKTLSETACNSTLTNATMDSTDCNDADAALNPATLWYADADSDGFGDDNTFENGCTSTLINATMVSGDCNDASATINPNTVWYEDSDNDGYGNDASFETACNTSFAIGSLQGGDCDDSQATVYIGAVEICDGMDNNCDGDTDEDLPMTEYYMDNDRDLYGGGSAGVFCYDPGLDYTVNPGDCNDDDPLINPGMPEIPGDTIDENCDGSLVGLDELAYYGFQLFPNPGSSELRITGVGLNGKEIRIEIRDLQGKVQQQVGQSNIQNQWILNTEKLANGIYMVRIELPEGSKTLRWMKL